MNTPVSGIFLVVGFVIRRRIEAYQPQTDYERAIHAMQKQRSMRQLWLCISTFIVQQCYQLLYSSYLHFSAGGCTMVTDSKVFNNIFWVFSRSMQNYLWIYPFIYIFWPRTKVITQSQAISK